MSDPKHCRPPSLILMKSKEFLKKRLEGFVGLYDRKKVVIVYEINRMEKKDESLECVIVECEGYEVRVTDFVFR